MGSSPIGHPNSRFLAALIIVSMSACARAEANLEYFSVCYGHGCASVASIALTTSEWQTIRELFSETQDAPAEREQLAQAIGAIEKLVGEKTGTASDRGGTGITSSPGQMDCIDESMNSTTYLTMLARDGLLLWHVIEERATRGWLILGWPHTTAVIRERASGEKFAVDSWFFDNGTPPAIVPLQEWKRGWTPKPQAFNAPN
ncbi:MAG: hypothetical protein ACREV0_13220 [Burkholderiales bacterium]